MSRKIALILGFVYIGAGLLLNPWVVERVASPDGSIQRASTILSICMVELFLIGFGILTIRKAATNWVANLNLLCLTLVVGVPVFGEAAFRMGIALKIEAFRRPGIYADYSSDDTYWYLQQKWTKNPAWRAWRPEMVHAVLGWSQEAPTAANPLGLFEATRERLGATGPKLLFFGDSFVRGVADREFQLPEYLNARLEGLSVVDLSVAAHGLDQIYLMFEGVRARAAGSLILVGILADDDLDRTVLSVRTSQKPYFALSGGGELLLRNVPIQRDQAAFFQRWSLPSHSYFLAFLKQRFIRFDEKIGLKQRISAKLLDRFVAEARAMGSELVFVIFYTEFGLRVTRWQESFLRTQLGRYNGSVFDTKPALLQQVADSGVSIGSLYVTGDGHHNNAGNRVIGRALVKFLKEKHGPSWTGRVR